MSVERFQQTRPEPKCVICAAALDDGARKCFRCGAFQDGLTCVSCGLSIPAGAEVCTSCKTLQRGDPCRACGATIAPGSRRCSECSSWQNWRRFFSGLEVTLAMVLALFSVIGAAVPVVLHYFTNHSDTYVRVLGAKNYAEPGHEEEMTIAVLAVNNGKRMSFVNAASLDFIRMDARSTPLRIRNLADQAVPPGSKVIIYFTGSPKTTHGKTPKEVHKSAKSGEVRIVVNIDESDRNGTVFTASREQIVPAMRLYDWIETHVANPDK